MLRAMAVVIGCGMGVAGAAATDVSEAVGKLAEAQGKVRSFSGRFESTAQVSKTMKYEAKGTYEWLRTDDKIRFRLDLQRTATHDLDGEKMEVKEDRTTLADGEFHYQINNETKNVLKQKFDPESPDTEDVRAVVGALAVRYDDLKVLPDEKVAGHDCVVIEASGNSMGGDDADDAMIAVVREVLWIPKDLGIAIRSEGYDRAGKVVRSRTFTEFKKDEKLDPARFVFKAPEGAQIMDRTKE